MSTLNYLSKKIEIFTISCCFLQQLFCTNDISLYAISTHAIFDFKLFFAAAILSTCSIVHAIMTNALIAPALLSGHPFYSYLISTLDAAVGAQFLFSCDLCRSFLRLRQ